MCVPQIGMLQFNEVLESGKDISDLRQKENLYLDRHLKSNSKFKNFGLRCSYIYRIYRHMPV